MRYNHVGFDNSSNITVVTDDGRMLVADDSHPLFDEIVERAKAGDASVADLFDTSRRAASKFENLSERVTVANSRVYVDGDEVDDVFADQIIRFLDEGVDDFKPLVNFLEKVYTNVEAHTRENLSRWLKATKGFTITDNGNIIGYKGLTASRTSIHSGPGIVNGEAMHGHLPNEDGSVVEMARSSVEHNPGVGCSVGLHVGTWEYARGFGTVVVEVEVNPRDVVSVPTDCSDQKMRVCRYEVVRALDEPHHEAVIPSGLTPAEDYKDSDAYQEGYDDGYQDGYSDAEQDVSY